MTSQNPSSDFASDLLLLINNSENYFNIEFPLNIQTNFTLLNTVWKEYGFSNLNGERSALNYAVGNFVICYLKNNYLENPYQIIYDGWSSLIHNDSISKTNVRKMESHFILGILTVFTNFRSLNLSDEECFQLFLTGVGPQLEQLEEFDRIVSSSNIQPDRKELFENFFTFDSYLNNTIKNDLPDEIKDYYKAISENQELILSTYFETYEKAIKYIDNKLSVWCRNETLFSI